jgi:choice-of-anchor B domain-containing protein
MKWLVLAVVVCVWVYGGEAVRHCNGTCQSSPVYSIGMNRVMPLMELEFEYCKMSGECPMNLKAYSAQPSLCTHGMVDVHEGYECDNVDLMSYISNQDLGSSHDANDIWGAAVGDHFLAIVGHEDGTSFVDITNTLAPVILGFLPAYDCGTVNLKCSKVSAWRDVKVYQNYAFIVSENRGHGMQVISLAKVLKYPAPILEADVHYAEFGNAHNIAINEESGYAYVVGTKTCAGGLHIVDIHNPLAPEFVSCFADDGYTHDCQCVNYDEQYPDSEYYGREICFNYNEDTLTIVDVTDKDDIGVVSITPYEGSQYTHQGWLVEDGHHLLLDDELDEMRGTTVDHTDDRNNFGARTRSMVWNVEKLSQPYWESSFFSDKTVIDHNMYIHNGRAFQSNYCGGLRVLSVSDITNVHQVGFFDLAPDCDGPVFSGSWSNYPYYDHPENENGKYQIAVVTSIERGLYVVRVHLH